MIMEDLRKNYNVNKGNLKFNPYVWWIKNRNVIVSILIIAFTSLLIFYPEIVGSYLGMWFESLVGSFMEKNIFNSKGIFRISNFCLGYYLCV